MPDSRTKFKHGGNLRELSAAAGIPEDEILDFSANINPQGPPDYLRSVLSANMSKLLHYPDSGYTQFREAAANHVKVAPQQIVVGNGSTEIIYALPRALPLKRAVIPAPSYVGYLEALQVSGLPVEILPLPEENNFAIDWEILKENLSSGELVFIGRPNNPTGGVFGLEELALAAAEFPDTLFVIDEAFIDFVPGQPSAISLIGPKHDNIVVLRSMTKFYAIPGLRLGFAVAAREVAFLVRSQLSPWSVNALALALAPKLFKDEQYARTSREVVTDWRQKLTEGIASIEGLKVYPSLANYLLVRIDKAGLDANDLASNMLKDGIAIRCCENYKGLDARYFRVAVRTPEENDTFLHCLSKHLGGTRPRKVKKKKPAIMFQGTSSDAGKSVLTAALCRILLQDGLRVAPFKSQNMSLNSFVTKDGGEMGRAQVVQAQACRLSPDVRMNPILLKPNSEVGSQVIVNGKPIGNMTVNQYVDFKKEAFCKATAAYDSLSAEFDAIVLEGAGSPAEVNLKSHDIVNMRMAQYAEAPVILVGDIDRGGVFASFVGSMEVMAEWERQLVAGFLVNRFRGQESLLAPAFDFTYQHTRRPVLGVVPYLSNLGLPEEDSVSFKKGLFELEPPSGEHVKIALIDLPHISNFTDFEPFLNEPDVHLTVVKDVRDLQDPDAILLPGSKNVINDIQYLKDSGIAERIRRIAEKTETEIVGICGGFQMLGRQIDDPHHIESSGCSEGMGLLPISTVLEKDKTLTRQSLVHIESGESVSGYEIHHGRTRAGGDPVFSDPQGLIVDAGAGQGTVWGTYLHGVFDADGFRGWFIDRLRKNRGLQPFAGVRPVYDLEPAFDRLAAMVRDRIDMNLIYKLLGI